jgi:hypothetical protein
MGEEDGMNEKAEQGVLLGSVGIEDETGRGKGKSAPSVVHVQDLCGCCEYFVGDAVLNPFGKVV